MATHPVWYTNYPTTQDTGVEQPNLEDDSAPGAYDGDRAHSSHPETLRNKLQSAVLKLGDANNLPAGCIGAKVATLEAGFSPSPLTTKADVYVRSATANARLPVSPTDGHVLTVDAANPNGLGLKWAAPAGGVSLHASTHLLAGGDPIALDTLAAPTDTVLLDASASKHGLMEKLSGVATQFYKGNGGFAVPPTVTTGAVGYCPQLNNNAAQFLNGQGGWATPAGGAADSWAGHNQDNPAVVTGNDVNWSEEFESVMSGTLGSGIFAWNWEGAGNPNTGNNWSGSQDGWAYIKTNTPGGYGDFHTTAHLARCQNPLWTTYTYRMWLNLEMMGVMDGNTCGLYFRKSTTMNDMVYFGVIYEYEPTWTRWTTSLIIRERIAGLWYSPYRTTFSSAPCGPLSLVISLEPGEILKFYAGYGFNNGSVGRALNNVFTVSLGGGWGTAYYGLYAQYGNSATNGMPMLAKFNWFRTDGLV